MKIVSTYGLKFGIIVAALLLLINTVVAYTNALTIRRNNDSVSETYQLVNLTDRALSLMKDAETGQRGFIITGDESYLGPYNYSVTEVPKVVDELEQFIARQPDQQQLLRALEENIAAKFAELQETIGLRREQGFEPAQRVVLTNSGKQRMDTIRIQVEQLQAIQRDQLLRRVAASTVSIQQATLTFMLATGFDLFLLSSVYIITARDLLRRQRSEAALRESEAQLAGIIGSAMDAIISVDEQQRIVVFNSAAEQMFRCTADEVRGQSLERFMPQAVRGRHTAYIPEFGKTGLTIRSMHSLQALTAVRTTGEEFPIEATISQTENAGSKLFTVVIRDITERKRAEDERTRLLEQEHAARTAAEHARHRLEVVAEVSRTLVATTLDLPGVLQTVARVTAEQLGDLCIVEMLDTEKQLLQVKAVHYVDPARQAGVEPLLHAPPRPVHAPATAQIMETGQPQLIQMGAHLPTDTVARLASLLEAERPNLHSAIIVPLRIQGNVTGLLNIIRDVTPAAYNHDDLTLAQELADRAGLAIENARLFAEAQEAIRVREVFLSIAAHELKTPLTSLLGYAFVLQRRMETNPAFNEREQRSVRAITEQGERLDRLINTLLNLSRIQLGRLTIDTQPLDLVKLTQRIVDEFRPMLEKHTLHTKMAESALVLGDELRLEQVLFNLLQNAVKYSLNGGPINVSVTVENGCGVITVTDRGIGIPQAAQANLFRQFYRASNVDPQKISGLGVGLYVVHEIVALHGGTLHVHSVEHEGSTFAVRLPLLTDTDRPALPTATSGVAQSQ